MGWLYGIVIIGASIIIWLNLYILIGLKRNKMLTRETATSPLLLTSAMILAIVAQVIGLCQR